MKNKFTELFEYSFHSNHQLIELIEKFSVKTPEKSVKLMNHILNAHQIWNARILGNPSFGTWEIHPLEEWEFINQSNYIQSKEILTKIELGKEIQYTNSQGIRYQNTVEDVLFHVINHSTYHRGQIALLFREAGIDPLVTDYIVFKR